MTKYEYQKQQLEERKKHESNIKDLNRQLTEAKDLYYTIQGLEKTFDNQQAAREVLREIRKLDTFIQDEQMAYKNTFEADTGSVDEVLKQLDI